MWIALAYVLPKIPGLILPCRPAVSSCAAPSRPTPGGKAPAPKGLEKNLPICYTIFVIAVCVKNVAATQRPHDPGAFLGGYGMSLFSGKTLLITGGTGSFGNTVLKHFLHTDIAEIRIFSRDEKKQDDMRKAYASDKLSFYIGDVRNPDSVAGAVQGVDYIFHAAALKQVPSCEFFPMEAVRTNIIGTDNVLAAASAAGVEKVVCLSTDKAAYPINAMGVSKAMMEKVVGARARDAKNTVICCTRYGNVMASRGSVIPLFIDQIRAGKPITITNPDMTRYLMSLDEAVALVVFAFENARPGDLFVQKSPASTISDLAAAVQSLFGETGVRVIGSRHGEKLYETLLTSEERIHSEDLGEYFRVPADNRDLNYDKYFVEGLSQTIDPEPYTSHNTRRLTLPQVVEKLRGLEYVRKELEAVGKL